MRRRSEMIDSILKSEKGKELLGYVSPIYDNGYVALWLFEALGRKLDYVFELIEKQKDSDKLPMDLMSQVLPNTATWSLDYWEQEYGLTAKSDLSERRNAIIDKIKSKNPMTPTRLAELCKSANGGYDVTIVENNGRNRFLVIVQAKDAASLRVNEMVQVLEQSKPAHLVYEIIYNLDENMNASIAFGACVSSFSTFEARQVNK